MEKQMLNAATPPSGLPEAPLFTIGHSDHELEYLLELLRQTGVTAVADVRSQPYSRWRPQFNRPELKEGLRRHGLGYIFLGAELGGRPDDRDLYDEQGRVDYERVRATEIFRRGLDRLCTVAAEHRVALLCAEEDPLDCHRGLMIAPALAERGLAPAHIRGGGEVESAVRFEERLLAVTGVGEGILDGLFAAALTEQERRELLADAYRVQARRKAFRLRPGEESGPEQPD